MELADQNTRALEEHVDSKNTSMLIPLWEKYGRLRIAHPTRPGSRLTTPGGPAERKLNGQEDRVDWVEEVVQSVKAHVKLGPVSCHPQSLWCGSHLWFILTFGCHNTIES
eukprot:COSAG02_NODE_858_length_16456_cov_7.419698_11_plen_110_part_00